MAQGLYKAGLRRYLCVYVIWSQSRFVHILRGAFAERVCACVVHALPCTLLVVCAFFAPFVLLPACVPACVLFVLSELVVCFYLRKRVCLGACVACECLQMLS